MPRTTLLSATFRRAAARWLRHIEIDDEWREAAREVAGRGPVVYVMRNVSVLDYLALDFLTHELELPPIGFVNELPPALSPRPPRGIESGSEQLRATLADGGSAALFLKRPPHRADLRTSAARRGRSGEGRALLGSLIDLQRADPEREIMMMPQTFVWTQRPERRGFNLFDTLFGPVDFPGDLRMAGQFLLNYDNCRLRAGEPLCLREFLAEQDEGESTDAIVHRLTYALLSKVERERRTIVGPAQKPPDRVREEVLRSPKLQAVIKELAGPGGEERALLTARARGMLDELMSVPDPETLRGLALVAEKVLERVYSGVDVDREGLERLRRLRGDGSVVLLPTHKSHIDYVVLSYVLRKNGIQVPVIAAGDNLSFFPAGPILRRCGAFFIRRTFRSDRLYTAVVDAYIRRLLRDGWMVEFFLEGGRSRTGKLLPPMLGLLNMVVASALGVRGRPIYFVPIAIGYERLMEERAFARELSGEKKQPEDATQLLKLGGVLTERWGRIDIQIGEAIELEPLVRDLGIDPRQVTPARRRAVVKRLAHRVMSELNRVTGVTPGSLVAMVLLSHKGGVAYRDLVAHSRRLTSLLLDLGARATPSLLEDGRFRERGIRESLRLYVKSGSIAQHVPGDTLTAEGRRRAALYTGTDVIFTVDPAKRLLLDFAKNQIIHWLVDRALISVALSCRPEAATSDGAPALGRGALRERVQSLSRLFKYEFMFRADASFDAIFDEVLFDMLGTGELREDGDRMTIGPGRDGLDGQGWITFHATIVQNFIEGYRIAARALMLLCKGPLQRKDLVARALENGERMFLQGEIERSEAVSQPMIEHAINSFIDQGYLKRVEEKVSLAESFQTTAAAATIENRIAAFLG